MNEMKAQKRSDGNGNMQPAAVAAIREAAVTALTAAVLIVE